MNDKDILSIIFDKIEDDGCFDFDDPERETLDESVTLADKKITNFIRRKIHPRNRKHLHNLIQDYSLATCSYFHKENELFFKNGVAIGIKIILNALSMKM